MSNGILNRVFAIAFILSISLGCNSDATFQESLEISPEGWTYEDKLEVQVPTLNAGDPDLMRLRIKHKPDYKYQNIYLHFSLLSNNGQILSTELKSFDLASKSGKWFGNCGNKTCTYEVSLTNNEIPFKEGQIIQIEQYTRDAILTSVNTVSVRFE
jgi:gliding motility-associated lipoprotein GldH